MRTIVIVSYISHVCDMTTYLLIICLLLMWLNCPKDSDENDDDDDDDDEELLIETSLYSLTLNFFNMIIPYIFLMILRIFDIF